MPAPMSLVPAALAAVLANPVARPLPLRPALSLSPVRSVLPLELPGGPPPALPLGHAVTDLPGPLPKAVPLSAAEEEDRRARRWDARFDGRLYTLPERELEREIGVRP